MSQNFTMSHDRHTNTLALRWRKDDGEFRRGDQSVSRGYIDFPPVEAVDANRRKKEVILSEGGRRRGGEGGAGGKVSVGRKVQASWRRRARPLT